METKLCQLCGEKVLRVKDEAGNWQELDFTAPVFSVVAAPNGQFCTRNRLAFVSHFSTCPFGLEVRKRLREDA